MFVVMLVVTAFAPLLPFADPNQQDVAAALQPPFWASGGDASHLLGTDYLGRDMLSRLVYGGRLTMFLVVSAVVASALVGVTLGVVAGFRGGWVDTIVSRLIDAQLALPFILLALTVVLAAGQSVRILVLVLAVASWAQFARIIRSEVISLRSRTFLTALRASHIRTSVIVTRHLLPNVLPMVLVVAAFQVGTVILAESGLSFLNMGVPPGKVSWGSMLADGKDYMRSAWWVVTLPGLAIVYTCLAFNMLADGLRDRFDPTVAKGANR